MLQKHLTAIKGELFNHFSEVLSIKHAPGNRVPEFGHRPDDESKVCSFVTGSTFQYSAGGGNAGIGIPSQSSSTTNSSTANITTTVVSAGSSGANANLQPYIVVYMWQRTA